MPILSDRASKVVQFLVDEICCHFALRRLERGLAVHSNAEWADPLNSAVGLRNVR
jgi:hypothetical protein